MNSLILQSVPEQFANQYLPALFSSLLPNEVLFINTYFILITQEIYQVTYINKYAIYIIPNKTLS